jgi:hypothetical protein
MKNRKAQAAIEFLTTYGWAILVIALVLVALGWLGVFSPGKTINQFCQFPINTFECNDAVVVWKATSPKLSKLEVTNNFGRKVFVCGVHCSAGPAIPEKGFPPDLNPAVSTYYTTACQAISTYSTPEGMVATVVMEPGARAVIPLATFMPSCYDETGVLRPFSVGSSYNGRLYVFYSFEGDIGGKSRLVVGNLLTQVQPG